MPDSARCLVIAEIGVNHNGSLGLALDLIDAAKQAGADAVKFQTFSAADLVTTTAHKAAYQERNTGDLGSQHDMLGPLELTEGEFQTLKQHCDQRGIGFLSTPFGLEAVDLLERVGVDAYKVSSGDLTYHQLLAYLGSKGKPIILSTGMSTMGEVEAALAVIEQAGPVPVSLLHCVSDYPAAPQICNLSAMTTMAKAFRCNVGWSDHTTGSAIGLAAVAMGASIIEKHITLDVTMDGPDHAASMEPDDFAQFVAGIREIEDAIGDGIKRPSATELHTAEVARRSLVAVRDLDADSFIRAEDVAILRPGTGLPPAAYDLIVGTRISRAVTAGQPFTMKDFRG